jgi:23S rRNA pseudouridine1911/1915/1917 synthase
MPKSRTVEEPVELLAYLFAAWPEAKKKQVRVWLKYQAVSVNERTVTQFNHPLKRGDVVVIRTERASVPKVIREGGMKVYFEDAAVIVIEKPEGLLTMGTETEQERTAYFRLTEYLRQVDESARNRVWIVHRLDRETSGLMVFAKSARAKEVLAAGWSKVEKRYEAVVEGAMRGEEGALESDLNEASVLRVFSAPPSALTRHAVTHYRVLKRGKGRSLVELSLETGRRHQIRVQLADAGCPVIGDKKYGAKSDPAKRVALHACLLRFTHPETGKELRFESPLPKELARLV